MIKDRASVVCYGETLWDILPKGKKPGGAPMNVAVHLKKFGMQAEIISSVGADKLGKKLVKFLKANNLGQEYIQKNRQHPTGVVNVLIDNNKNAIYDIVFPSAWDFIVYEDELEELVQGADFFVYGSLASRNDVSRNTLFRLINKANKKVFDINLRSPHYNDKLVAQLLEGSNIVKVNEEELEVLNNWYVEENYTLDVICKTLQEKFSIEMLIVTKGGKGAFVSHNGKTYEHSGFKVEVEDTVGSGDSFLAAFLSELTKGDAIEDCLQFACATGAFVATQKGANPNYKAEDIKKFIEESQ